MFSEDISSASMLNRWLMFIDNTLIFLSLPNNLSFYILINISWKIPGLHCRNQF